MASHFRAHAHELLKAHDQAMRDRHLRLSTVLRRRHDGQKINMGEAVDHRYPANAIDVADFAGHLSPTEKRNDHHRSAN